MMKRLNFIISFVVAILFSVMSPISSMAYNTSSLQYTYDSTTKQATVVKPWHEEAYGHIYYNNYEGDIIVPSETTYNGEVYTVTEIGANAFKRTTPNGVDSDGGPNKVTSVILPNTITTIGSEAFVGCNQIKEIDLPESLLGIGYRAFASCTGLTTLTLPESLEFLGRDAFVGCISLQSLTILSPKVEIIGSPFMGTKLVSYWGSVTPYQEDKYKDNRDGYYFSVEKLFWLSNTTPPITNAKVTYVSTSNVSTDETLKRVEYLSSNFTAENGLRYIPISPQNRTAMALDFDYSQKPEDLTIPEKVTYKGIEMDVIQAGNYCCSQIKTLEHINVEAKLPEIPDGFIYQCSNVKDFIVDRYPTRIGKSAFEGCTAMGDFVMLDWSTDVTVDVNAFANCGLENIRIGRQLVYNETEESSPFANNSTLKTVWITDIPTSIDGYMFKGCRSLKDVSVGDRVSTIGEYAFAECSSISRFCFGRSVKSIARESFSDCTGMKNLYAEPVSPPICGSQALDDINRWECTLHVQSQSKEAYSTAPQWREFLFVDYGFGLTINVTSMYMEIGDTFQLRVMENSSPGDVVWKSTNESILTVSDSGLVTAVGSGSASIAAINSEGMMDNCAITVAGESGIQDVTIQEETMDSQYRVYNIQGILLMDTTDKSALSNLPTGLYIINGKKILVN